MPECSRPDGVSKEEQNDIKARERKNNEWRLANGFLSRHAPFFAHG